ncbi:GPW/gp25 family protein [Candidatus Bipolaricaulota bacterium]
MSPSHVDYPFRMDASGRTARTDEDDHVRDMIRQVLFTNPGERVNRPDFGCGLLHLVFLPNSDALAATTQHLVHGALQQWLGDVIRVEDVRVIAEEERLAVEVVYIRRGTGHRNEVSFDAPMGGT